MSAIGRAVIRARTCYQSAVERKAVIQKPELWLFSESVGGTGRAEPTSED
jgi:hypothetical protein